MIEHRFNQKFANLQQALHKHLLEGETGDNDNSDVNKRMKDLISEDTDIAKRRQFLQECIGRLGEIREKLDTV